MAGDRDIQFLAFRGRSRTHQAAGRMAEPGTRGDAQLDRMLHRRTVFHLAGKGRPMCRHR